MIIGYDTETTGTIPGKARVCQLAAAAVFPDKKTVVPVISTLCNPGIPIPKEAGDVHGITDKDVQMAPGDVTSLRLLTMYIKALEAASGQTVYLSGHNIRRYDNLVVDARLPSARFEHRPSIDTLQIAIRQNPGGVHKLSELYEAIYGEPARNAHDAMADVVMAAKILFHYMDELQMNEAELVEWLNEPVVLEAWPWGKHKGTPMEKVPKSYLGWAQRNLKDVSDDVLVTIEEYVNA